MTFIYVTHDQDEALSMSDRVVILKDGRIQQEGVPDKLYRFPRNRFVADFLGKSNFLDLPVKAREGDELTCTIGGTAFPVTAPGATATVDVLKVALRPERIRLGAPGQEMLDGTVRQVSYLGERCLVLVDHAEVGALIISQPTWKADVTPKAGLPVSFGWDVDAPVILEDGAA